MFKNISVCFKHQFLSSVCFIVESHSCGWVFMESSKFLIDLGFGEGVLCFLLKSSPGCRMELPMGLLPGMLCDEIKEVQKWVQQKDYSRIADAGAFLWDERKMLVSVVVQLRLTVSRDRWAWRWRFRVALQCALVLRLCWKGYSNWSWVDAVLAHTVVIFLGSVWDMEILVMWCCRYWALFECVKKEYFCFFICFLFFFQREYFDAR